MKKLISVLLVTLMLLSSVTVVTANDTSPVESLELVGATCAADGFQLTTSATFPLGVSGDVALVAHYNSAGPFVGVNKLDSTTTAYCNMPVRAANNDPTTIEEHLGGGNLEDYILEVTFKKKPGASYLTNIEMGLGNYIAPKGQASSFNKRPHVIKTYSWGLSDTDFHKMADNDVATLRISVKDILENGTLKEFPYNGTEPNDLTHDNANLIALKATQSKTTNDLVYAMNFTSIRFVKKTDDCTVNQDRDNVMVYASAISEDYVLITAFYDADNNLVSVDIEADSPLQKTVAIPSSKASKVRGYVWSDLDTLKPIVASGYMSLSPFINILALGGRNAEDCTAQLSALAEENGDTVNVYVLSRLNRTLRDHWRCTLNNANDYTVTKNGKSISAKALTSAKFDKIIIEQVSGYCGVEESLFPYINYLAEYMEEIAPNADIYYNSGWTYPQSYTGSIFVDLYENSPLVMKNKIDETVDIVNEKTNIKIIDTNNIMYNLLSSESFSSDLYAKEDTTTFYRASEKGKIILAAKWYQSLLGKKPTLDSLIKLGLTADEAQLVIDNL